MALLSKAQPVVPGDAVTMKPCSVPELNVERQLSRRAMSGLWLDPPWTMRLASGSYGHASLSGAFKFEAELPPLNSGAR